MISCYSVQAKRICGGAGAVLHSLPTVSATRGPNTIFIPKFSHTRNSLIYTRQHTLTQDRYALALKSSLARHITLIACPPDIVICLRRCVPDKWAARVHRPVGEHVGCDIPDLEIRDNNTGIGVNPNSKPGAIKARGVDTSRQPETVLYGLAICEEQSH